MEAFFHRGFMPLARRLGAVACLVCLSSFRVSLGEVHPLVFHSFLEASLSNSSLPSSYAAPYFEQKYPTGWFTSPVIFNAHVETNQLVTLLTQRRRTHYPGFVSAHCVEYPSHIVLFNVLWIPNAQNWKWTLALSVDGADLQAELDKALAAGLKPKQIDSYAFQAQYTIYYAAVFVENALWAPGTKFDIRFGVPNDPAYCCGPSSRSATLRRAGFKPLSISLTQDPVTHGVYVADVWNTRDVDFWQADIDKAPGELQSTLAALAPPLVPFYVKAYRVSSSDGSFRIYYSFIAESDASITSYAATVDISRSALELFSKVLKRPPLHVTSLYLEGEIDPQDPSSGDVYTAVWQQTNSVSEPVPKVQTALRLAL